jgi:hypothetical protein
MIPHGRGFCQGEECALEILAKKVGLFFISSFLFSPKDGKMELPMNTDRLEALL